MNQLNETLKSQNTKAILCEWACRKLTDAFSDKNYSSKSEVLTVTTVLVYCGCRSGSDVFLSPRIILVPQ